MDGRVDLLQYRPKGSTFALPRSAAAEGHEQIAGFCDDLRAG